MTEKLPVLTTRFSSDDTKEYQLSESGFKFRVYSSVNHLDQDWTAGQPPDNIYLQRPILAAIEEAPPKGIRPCYFVFFQNDKPIGVAYCQLMVFKTDENVQDKDGKGALKSITGSVKSFLAKRFEYTLLVCGNLLFTGEHGYFFDENKLNTSKATKFLEEALVKAQIYWREKGVKIDGIFLKDVGDENATCRKDFLDQKFREFLFHPNMVLYLRPEWNSFDDYLAAISSKYRVRAKKAFKCGKVLEKAVLNLEQLKTNKDRLYELYKGVMATAGFNMVTLNENYIVKLKENLGDRLRVTGYYLNGELIGYRTNIKNFNEVEAHFLGYDQSYNKQYKLYMNMLYDSLKYGISHQADRIVYARTAMEIKSTIGAIPENLFCYIRANNKLMNRLMPSILEYFRPDDNWVQRKPFKEIAN